MRPIKSILDRVKKLRATIDDLRYRYHVLDDPKVTDASYDSLMRELINLEQTYPKLKTADSPSQRVGGEPLKQFTTVHHTTPMLSLNDAFDEAALKAWETRVKKLAPATALTYYAELKMDGLAIALVYEDGVLSQAATRGDGLSGEDVTTNIKTIQAIPLILRKTAKTAPYLKGTIEIRGEAYMPRKSFQQLNAARQKAGQPLFVNPRNAAAGSIRQLDPKITAHRHLSFMAYQVLVPRRVKKHHEEHELAHEFGFAADGHNRLCDSIRQVVAYWHDLEKRRDRLPFQVDGLVVGLDDNATRTRFGVAGKAPRAMIAFKWPAQEATTVVEDIIVQVGRTGALTPVAHLRPVVVGGATVSRATLHNADEIARKGVRVGDTVVIRRAGDVIPEVVKVLPELRPKGAKVYTFLQACPVCHTKAIKQVNEAVWRCPNPNCLSVRHRRLEHFVGKAAFDMDGLGPKILDRFIDEDFINSFVDLFDLKTGDIASLERFGKRSATNIVATIESHKTISLERFLFALGIRGVGSETAVDLARFLTERLGKMTRVTAGNANVFIGCLGRISRDDWRAVPDIGPVVAKSLEAYFSQKANQKFMGELLNKGVVITLGRPRGKKTTGLSGQTFVFTGALKNQSREEAKNLVRRLGGDTSESVSRQTGYVVAGRDPGSKYDRARKLGVKVLTEKDFLALIKNSG